MNFDIDKWIKRFFVAVLIWSFGYAHAWFAMHDRDRAVRRVAESCYELMTDINSMVAEVTKK